MPLPPLGIFDKAAGAATSFESIATVTVGSGGSSSISFSSIPSTFAHLQIRGIARSASTNPNLTLRMNGDTTASYTEHYLIGNGSTVSAGGTASTTFSYVGNNAPSGTTANNFGVSILDIFDYTDTNKYKTVRALSGYDDNGSGIVSFKSSVFQKTNAVSSLTIAIEGGANFAQYSHFALYGIKSA